jgi:hypothetical protein
MHRAILKVTLPGFAESGERVNYKIYRSEDGWCFLLENKIGRKMTIDANPELFLMYEVK